MASERTSREASQASTGPVSVVRRSSTYLLEETNGELGINKRRSGILVERSGRGRARAVCPLE
jgi:hypothetical protein